MLNSNKSKLKFDLNSIDIKGVSFPVYLSMFVVLVVVVELNKLPNTIVGAIAVLVLLGNILHYLGGKIPIIKSYLGGGSVFCIFISALLATIGVIPKDTVNIVGNFVDNMGFLDFYIAALITGAILGMDRQMLIKASIRFIPVAFLSIVASVLTVGLVGFLLGNGFLHSILYIAFPIMAGGIGAGVVPLSNIYAHGLGISSSSIISQLIPASAMGNILAIIGAALFAKVGEYFPNANGHGQLIKETTNEYAKDKNNDSDDIKPQLNTKQIGVGLLVAFTFFLIGIIGNYFFPKIHTYAFMIIFVVIAKVLNILPKYYIDSAIMFNNVVVKNLTPAVLAGIGIALLNLKVLVGAFTWQFILLCLISIFTISIISGLLGKLFGLYPVESVIAAGMCNNSMGGTGNVAVLSAANRMNLIAFAQMGNRLGGAIILIVSGLIT